MYGLHCETGDIPLQLNNIFWLTSLKNCAIKILQTITTATDRDSKEKVNKYICYTRADNLLELPADPNLPSKNSQSAVLNLPSKNSHLADRN